MRKIIDEKVIVMKPHLEVTLRKPRDDISNSS